MNMQDKDATMPHSGQSMQHSTPADSRTPIDEGRTLLATIEAEIRGAETDLSLTMHEGAEHFRAGMEKATAGLQDADLDGWADQAAALARVGSADGRMPAHARGEVREDS